MDEETKNIGRMLELRLAARKKKKNAGSNLNSKEHWVRTQKNARKKK